jgi:hypothetical protein
MEGDYCSCNLLQRHKTTTGIAFTAIVLIKFKLAFHPHGRTDTMYRNSINRYATTIQDISIIPAFTSINETVLKVGSNEFQNYSFITPR